MLSRSLRAARIAVPTVSRATRVRTFTSTMATAKVTMRGAASAQHVDVGFRVESDTMGKVNVPNDVYWGAQTQRSLENFKIGGPSARMPIEVIRGESIQSRRRYSWIQLVSLAPRRHGKTSFVTSEGQSKLHHTYEWFSALPFWP